MPPTKRGAAAGGKGAAAGGGKKGAKKSAKNTEAPGAAGEKSAVMQLGDKNVKMTYTKAMEHWEYLMRCEGYAERDSLIKQNSDLYTAMYGPNIVTQHGPMGRNVLTGLTLFDDDLEDVEIPCMPKPEESDFGPEMISADNEDMASQVFFMPWYVSMVQALAVEVQKLRQELKKVEPLVAEVNQLRQEAGQSGSLTPVNEAAEDADDDDDDGHILYINAMCGNIYQIPLAEIASDLTRPLARYLETGWNGVIVERREDPSFNRKQEQEISKYVEFREYKLADLIEELILGDFDKYLVQPYGDVKTTHKYLAMTF